MWAPYIRVMIVALMVAQGPLGARTYSDTRREFRGSQFVSQTWDKTKDSEFSVIRRELDAVWKLRKPPKPGALANQFRSAYKKWNESKTRKDLYRANVLAYIARSLDREVVLPTDLADSWKSVGNYGSLELARSYYLGHAGGRLDGTSLLPLAKQILQRNRDDEMVQVKFCIEASTMSIKDRPVARQIAERHLEEAYTDPVWCEAAALIVGSHAYKSSNPSREASLAYQLTLRFEQMTGRKAPFFGGSSGLKQNWQKARPSDPSLAASPWLFGPKKGQMIPPGG